MDYVRVCIPRNLQGTGRHMRNCDKDTFFLHVLRKNIALDRPQIDARLDSDHARKWGPLSMMPRALVVSLSCHSRNGRGHFCAKLASHVSFPFFPSCHSARWSNVGCHVGSMQRRRALAMILRLLCFGQNTSICTGLARLWGAGAAWRRLVWALQFALVPGPLVPATDPPCYGNLHAWPRQIPESTPDCQDTIRLATGYCAHQTHRNFNGLFPSSRTCS
ncbi:hypothetical protein IWX49DRAFT_390329 [Phyllosticta citricarpa]|uniref:Uncharacterized protein n=2 Tax=Phyllosticta TaxID=121621 RepID=A0ABR1MCU0_9PEZI